MKSTAYLMGIICGVVLVALAAYAGSKLMKRSQKKGPKEYDERQVLARGKACQAAYYTLLIYLAAYGFFDAFTGIVWCDRFAGVFIGIALSVAVYAIGCIMKDAYFRAVDSPRAYLILFTVVGLCNVAFGVVKMVEGTFLEEGILTMGSSANFIVGVMLLVVLAVLLGKMAHDRRTEETE